MLKLTTKYIIALLLICLPILIFSQPGFKGGLTLGLNTAQINGDGLAGYDKFGITAGFQTSFTLKERSRLALEFLYSQRGSQSSVIAGVPNVVKRIHLDYIEIPLIYQYNDWFIEEDKYYKVKAEAGLSFGYLVNVTTSNVSPNIDDGLGFNKRDLSFLIGGGYQFNSRWALNIRYTRSLVRLFTLDLPGEPNYPYLLGYFLSFRSEFFF